MTDPRRMTTEEAACHCLHDRLWVRALELLERPPEEKPEAERLDGERLVVAQRAWIRRRAIWGWLARVGVRRRA